MRSLAGTGRSRPVDHVCPACDCFVHIEPYVMRSSASFSKL